MSQVKNLRAMFENKGEDSSLQDNRGRSPTGSTISTDGPRPLSKVRSSFVAIEKDGRIGLQRDHSGESSLSRRRMSTDTESNQARSMASPDDMVRKNSAFGSEPIAEDGAVTDYPSTNPDKSIDVESPAALQPADASKSNASVSSATSPPAKSSATKKPTPRPTTKPVAPAAATRTARPTSSTAAARQPVKTTRPSDTGFVKPKPKSPTKPVNVPSSLMAPTASSVSKGAAGGRQSSTRQSLPQSASAHSVGTSSTAKAVKRQSSVTNRTRPSVGPPPSRHVRQESSSNKRQSQVDDGFLARMMRPTQSSSSKTSNEKAPVAEPPKKTAARTSTVGTRAPAPAAVRKPAVASRTSLAKRPEPTKPKAAEPAKTAKPKETKPESKAPAPAKEAGKAAAVAVPIVAAPIAVGTSAVAGEDKLASDLGGLKIDESEPAQSSKEPEVEVEPEAEPEPEPEAEPEATEPKVEAEPEVELEPEHEPEAKAEPEAEPEAAIEPEVEEQAVDEPELNAETHPEPEEELVPEPEPEAEVEEHHEEPELEPEADHEDIVEIDDEPAHAEEPIADAAQVETAEEAIDVADEVDATHPVIEDNIPEAGPAETLNEPLDKALGEPTDELVDASVLPVPDSTEADKDISFDIDDEPLMADKAEEVEIARSAAEEPKKESKADAGKEDETDDLIL